MNKLKKELIDNLYHIATIPAYHPPVCKAKMMEYLDAFLKEKVCAICGEELSDN